MFYRSASLPSALLVLALVGCGSGSGTASKRATTAKGAAATTTSVAATPAAAVKTPTADERLARRIRRELRENYGVKPFRTSWWPLVGRIEAVDGDVTVHTRIGDDSDADGPVTAMCGVIGPLQTDIKGIEHVAFLGDDRYGNESEIGHCPG